MGSGQDHAVEPVSEEGLHRGLRERHIQLIAIGGAIGVGLFLAWVTCTSSVHRCTAPPRRAHDLVAAGRAAHAHHEPDVRTEIANAARCRSPGLTIRSPSPLLSASVAAVMGSKQMNSLLGGAYTWAYG